MQRQQQCVRLVSMQRRQCARLVSMQRQQWARLVSMQPSGMVMVQQVQVPVQVERNRTLHAYGVRVEVQ
jgi:hypothetical protein